MTHHVSLAELILLNAAIWATALLAVCLLIGRADRKIDRARRARHAAALDANTDAITANTAAREQVTR